ncbi:AAA family ATPase [Stutzerimonas stutzeri]|uniref:AAA family ATPase n=1 Tax=Stutzerimonas stutzeri TaxID=316 RepID=UPI0002FCBABA|nr:AAA family ATPase [Stutzerimonas stutzeri]
MQKPAAQQKTVLETILDWSKDRPLWQRDALRRIIANGRLTDADIGELVDLCKQGKGAPVGALKAVPLEKAHLPANPGQTAAVSLLSIADVTGVNNLAAGQTLGLEPNGITIIYGDNGAGKSGYARILKRACRARHAGKIEPNVYADQPPKRVGANIEYGVGGVPQPVEQWQNGANPHATLSAVSVFDSDCASVHIREKNEVAFRPFGLDVPDELAAACQAVKDALAAEQKQLEKARNPIFAAPTWKATTAVGKALAALNANTDAKKIEALAALSADESVRLERLREDLSKNPTKAAAEQAVKADNVMRLITAVNSVAAKTTDEELLAAAALARDARSKRGAARLAPEKAFTGEPLAGVGGETWRALWDSARRYSTEIAYPGQPFPPSAEDAHCMLCQQPLEAEARARMVRFEDFIQKDTEQLAREAEKAAQTARQTIAAGAIGTRAVKASLDELGLQNEVLQQQTRRFIAAARLRRHVLLKALGGNGEVQLPPVPPSPLPDLGQLQTTIRDYAAELRKSADADERKKLEADFAELSDRALLAGMLPVVTDEIQRLKTIRFLTECAGDTATNTITKMGNDIADTVITPRLRDRFQEEIVRLAASKVRVEIVRSGGKYGSPQYQVRLFAKPDAKVHEILSEGEKTCVALAAFMTELATAMHRSALVFDDPVSSLDHRWRGQVAKRLVEEAENRQVIVFTHDLVFVNDLNDHATKTGRAVRLTTLSRGAAGAGMVADGLPWKAQSVEDRIDKLEKAARAAKLLHDNNQEDEYAVEVAKLYNALRATWERGLEDIAFVRVIQRHRDYINAKDLKKVSALTEADCDAFAAGFKKCCDIVDAHDPSSGRNAAPPPPTDLFQDIQALKDWAASLRDRQKKIA